MTDENLEHILREEAHHAEEHKDAPWRDGTVITHNNQRSYVFSIRLSESQRSALEQAARLEGVAPSSLARQWIAERLVSEAGSLDHHAVADALETLSRQVRALPVAWQEAR